MTPNAGAPWVASLLSLVAGGPFVPRLIDTQPPTTRQRHFGEQTPALILNRATGDAVLTHFRDKHVYVVAQQIEFLLQVVQCWMDVRKPPLTVVRRLDTHRHHRRLA